MFSSSIDVFGGIPVISTSEKYLTKVCQEVIGIISGSNLISTLGGEKWGRLSPGASDVEEEILRIKKDVESNEDKEKLKMFQDEKQLDVLRNYLSSKIGTLGPVAPVLFRGYPRLYQTPTAYFEGTSDLPSDKKEIYKTGFMQQVLLSNGQLKNTEENWDRYAVKEYFKTTDQFNIVYLGLKKDPFSKTHIVNLEHPELKPLDSLSPIQNVFAGKPAISYPIKRLHFFISEKKDHSGLTETKLGCSVLLVHEKNYFEPYFYQSVLSIILVLMSHCLKISVGWLLFDIGNFVSFYPKEFKTISKVKLNPPLDKTDLFNFDLETLVKSLVKL